MASHPLAGSLLHRTLTQTSLMALLVASAGLTSACDHPASNVTVEDNAPSPDATAPVISLPEPPSASDFVIKETNDDGTLRVQGLIEYKSKHLDKEVVVTGQVVRLSAECDPAKAKKDNEKCPELHMIIQDNEQDAETRILVVGYGDDFLKRSKLKEGDVHQFKAMYKMMGWGFTSSEDGLLELISMDDVDVIEAK